MKDEPFIVNYFSAKDCYLYFSDYWVKRLNSLSTPSFALRIDYKNGKHAFFSWSPQSRNISDDSIVRVSATYAQKLGIDDGEKVTVSFTNAASVSRVFVSPITPDDFEILAMNQDLLQSGLLDQIQIVWPGQTFVAWVGTSMHAILHVDSMEPNTSVGRLQVLTEIVVNDPTQNQAQGDPLAFTSGQGKKADPNMPRSDDETTLHKKGSVVSFIWDSVQGISSRLWRREDLEKDSRVSIVSVLPDNIKFLEPLVYRIHPINLIDDRGTCSLLQQPYNAFVHKKNLPPALSHSEKYVLVKIVPLSFISKTNTSANEDEEKVSGKERMHNFGSTCVYVKVCVIDDILDSLGGDEKCEVGKAFKHDGLRCIFVSHFIRAALQVKIGARVRLEVEKEPCEPSSVELELTYVGMGAISHDLDVHWEKYLLKSSKAGEVVINSGAIIPLRVSDKTCHIIVKVTEPSVPYCVFTSNNVDKCRVKISSIRAFVPIPKSEDMHFQFTENHHCFSHLEKEIYQGLTNLEMTLGLTCVPWPSKESFISVVNVLIVGKSGSGSSTLAKYLTDKLRKPPWYVHCVEIQCRNIKGKKVETLLRTVNLALNECCLHEPAILLLQDLDALAAAPSHDQDVAVQENNYYARVGEMIVELLGDFQPMYKIAVIATAAASAKLNSTLMSARGQHTFLSVLQVPDLNKEDRLKILDKLVERKVSIEKSQLDLNTFAQKSDGYVVQDLVDFVEKAVFEAWKRKVIAGDVIETAPCLENVDLEKAFQLTQPLALRGVELVQDASLSWADIGGLEQAKKLLIEMLEWPVQFPELFAQAPLRLQSGLLLYGAPGTGKTLLAGAVAKECGLNFISVKGPELLSKYIGASEEAVRTVFLKAQSAKPCVLFFDEFDSLAPRRGHDSTGVTDRVVNQLLTQLDGVESLSSVWVLAATSRPDLLDPALLRPGRLDHAIICPLPSEEDRLAILHSLSRKMCLDDDVELSPLAQASSGFTGADLQAVLYTAQLAAVEQMSPLENSTLDEKSSKMELSPPVQESACGAIRVTQTHLLAALKDTRPSLNFQERRKYELIYQNFEKSRTSSAADQKITSLRQKVTLA